MSKAHEEYHKETHTKHHRGEEPEIKRAAYHRKAHERSGYYRSNGTYVGPTHVKAADVPSTYIPSRVHRWTKGQKLIDIKDYRHLREFGYSFSKTPRERHSALKKAIEHNGWHWALRRLNAIGNISHTANPKATKIAREDMEYVETHKK